jgi:hypothetical protein
LLGLAKQGAALARLRRQHAGAHPRISTNSPNDRLASAAHSLRYRLSPRLLAAVSLPRVLAVCGSQLLQRYHKQLGCRSCH